MYVRCVSVRPYLRPVLVAALVAASLGPASCAYAQAGEPGEPPAVAMGAGRMVRGTVTATAPDKLTIKSETGEVYTVALTPNTQIRHGRDAMKPGEVHNGDGVGAMGEVDRPNKTVHALFVQVISADDIKKAKESFGKTWIAGTVTAIDEVKITILRTDKVSQVIEVDEDTSFKRGGRNLQAMMQGGGMEMGGGFGPGGGQGGGRRNGAGATPPPVESLTLADVKVGATVAGQGTLKAGVFTPKELLVGDPNAATQRRRRPADTATTPGGTPPGRSASGAQISAAIPEVQRSPFAA